MPMECNRFSVLLGERLMKISKIAIDTGILRTTLTNLYYRRSRQISFKTLNTLCRYLESNIGDILRYEPNKS